MDQLNSNLISMTNQLNTKSITITQNLGAQSSIYARRDFCELPDDTSADQHYITAIKVGSTTYKLRCEIVEVHPLTCTKCGSPLELHNGHGRCEYCGTSYSAVMSIVEDK